LNGIFYHADTDYYIAMHTVGDSNYITCTLDFVFTYAWYDEDNNTIVNGQRLSYVANDSIHHKLFTCSGLNLLTLDTEAIHIKFVINGNDISVIITSYYNNYS
jgi:hypothetical protein